MNSIAKSRPPFRIKTVLGLSFSITLGLCGLFWAHAFATSQLPGAEPHAIDDYASAFVERQRAVVAVEGIVRNEIDRDVVRSLGLVLDAQGRIVLPETFLPGWLPATRFGDFKVRFPGEEGDGAPATYLGQDYVTGWHYLQITDKKRWADYRPIGSFGFGEPRIGDELWGIAIRSESWNYLPYFLSARMSASIALPWLMGFTDQPVASPGSAVFDARGHFVGWAATASAQEHLLFMQHQHYRVGIQSLRESGSFISAQTFQRFADRIPQSAEGDPRPWLGLSGLQSLDRDVAEVMGLQDRGALVVSDVIEGSPAAQGGLKGRDIVVGFNGEPLPQMQPAFILPQWLEFQLMSQQVGDTITFDIVRGAGGAPQPLSITLAAEPTTLKQAQRQYYPRLGLGVREFTLYDGIAKLLMSTTAPGVIADFIRPNGAVDSGGLEQGDWIQAIDGTDVADFAAAQVLLSPIEADTQREEIVLLVKRNNETKVLRIKLH